MLKKAIYTLQKIFHIGVICFIFRQVSKIPNERRDDTCTYVLPSALRQICHIPHFTLFCKPQCIGIVENSLPHPCISQQGEDIFFIVPYFALLSPEATNAGGQRQYTSQRGNERAELVNYSAQFEFPFLFMQCSTVMRSLLFRKQPTSSIDGHLRCSESLLDKTLLRRSHTTGTVLKVNF